MKNIIITGAASGIGRATAKRLAAQGWYIGAMDIDRAALDALVGELGSEHCHAITLDVRRPADIETAFAAFIANAGHLDALFNCAGVIEVGDFATFTHEQHQRIIDVNVSGVVHGTHAAFKFLRERNDACVVSMCSASAMYGIPGFASYSASKFFVKGLTEALDIEWQKYGIRVCDIAPPFVASPMLNDTNSPFINKLGVKLVPDDIAAVVVRALAGHSVHYRVSLQFRLLHAIGKLLPDALVRRAVKLLAAP